MTSVKYQILHEEPDIVGALRAPEKERLLRAFL
jgi:hypothetical protein